MRIVFGIGTGQDRDGNTIRYADAALLITEAVTLVSQEYGGCFVVEGDGGWIDGKGKLLTERGIQIIVEKHGDYVASNVLRIRDTANLLRIVFKQSSVVVSVSPSEVFFVEEQASEVPTSSS